MEYVEHYITIDLLRERVQDVIHIREAGVGHRLHVRLCEGMSPYALPEAEEGIVQLVYQVPDGTKSDTVMDVANDEAVAVLPRAALENAGDVESEVRVYDNTAGTWTTTARFLLDVQRVIYDEDAQEEIVSNPSVYEMIVGSEAGRVAAENARAEAETAREAAETARETAETARAAAETAREAAETARESAETDRAAAETARETAETARASAESDRAAAETARETAETARAAAEAGRVSAEADRATAETARASAETARESAEAARAAAEAARVLAETGRAAAETARESAEAARAAAEAERQAKHYLTPADVDDALDENSENPVQNKVITAALQNVSVDTDDALSPTSTNPVQNKVIKAALDDKMDAEWDLAEAIFLGSASGTQDTSAFKDLTVYKKEMTMSDTDVYKRILSARQIRLQMGSAVPLQHAEIYDRTGVRGFAVNAVYDAAAGKYERIDDTAPCLVAEYATSGTNNTHTVTVYSTADTAFYILYVYTASVIFKVYGKFNLDGSKKSGTQDTYIWDLNHTNAEIVAAKNAGKIIQGEFIGYTFGIGETVLMTPTVVDEQTDGNNVGRLVQFIGTRLLQARTEVYTLKIYQYNDNVTTSVTVNALMPTYEHTSEYEEKILMIYQGVAQWHAPLTEDAPYEDDPYPITSGGVYTALQGKQNTLTFDDAPTSGSDNLVKSGGVYSAIATAIAGVTEFELYVCAYGEYNPTTKVPTVSSPDSHHIYLVPDGNVYLEYVYINSAYELVGSTQVDLSNYYTKTQMDTALDEIREAPGKLDEDVYGRTSAISTTGVAYSGTINNETTYYDEGAGYLASFWLTGYLDSNTSMNHNAQDVGMHLGIVRSGSSESIFRLSTYVEYANSERVSYWMAYNLTPTWTGDSPLDWVQTDETKPVYLVRVILSNHRVVILTNETQTSTPWRLFLRRPYKVAQALAQNSEELAKAGTVYAALSGKQDTLTWDNIPASGSDHPVKSGGLYTALAGKANNELTQPMVVSGGDSSSAGKISLDQSRAGQITNNDTGTIFGFLNNNDTNLTVGSSSYALKMRGSGTRPQFNGNNLALYSDIPSNAVKGYNNSGTATAYTIKVSTSAPGSGTSDTQITIVV